MPNERMTDERLAEIEERRRNIDIRVWNVFFRVDCVASSQSHEMVFGSNVPDDVDELLAEVRRLRADVAGYRSAIAKLLEFFEQDNPGVLADAYSILKGADHAKA